MRTLRRNVSKNTDAWNISFINYAYHQEPKFNKTVADSAIRSIVWQIFSNASFLANSVKLGTTITVIEEASEEKV